MDAWIYAVVDGEIWNEKIKYNKHKYFKLELF